MDVDDFDIAARLQEHCRVVHGLHALMPPIADLADRMTDSLRRGGKIIWFGNGGSAADCQHLAAELVGRFARERGALASLALTTDTSILTAVANDYDFAAVFARQVEALCRPDDVVVGISTSGASENVRRALDQARRLGAYTAALTGAAGGRLTALADACIQVPSTVTARIQEAHILIGHILCEWIENRLAATARPRARQEPCAP